MSGKRVMNEQIKAAEVLLEGLDGERLGVVSRQEALTLAKEAKADLVCLSLMSSPPPCKLMPRGEAKRTEGLAKRQGPGKESAGKTKELRLTAGIEEHDYDTKQRQAAKLLKDGHNVQLVIRLQGGKDAERAKALLERLCADLGSIGKRESGIQVSGKQAAVCLQPVLREGG